MRYSVNALQGVRELGCPYIKSHQSSVERSSEGGRHINSSALLACCVSDKDKVGKNPRKPLYKEARMPAAGNQASMHKSGNGQGRDSICCKNSEGLLSLIRQLRDLKWGHSFKL